MPSRPDHLIFVTGTGTGTGKTWFGSQLMTALKRRGNSVAARKPVQSFGPGEDVTDADVLAQASGEQPSDVCPLHRWYEVPMAPPMAAEVVGRPPFTVAELVDELRWPAGLGYGLVEGVGGPRSPLACDGDTVTLAERLEPDTTLLLASPELGVINAVLLAVSALPRPSPVVVLNRYREENPLHVLNAQWLRERAGLEVLTEVDSVVSRLGLS